MNNMLEIRFSRYPEANRAYVRAFVGTRRTCG
nr:MAG TPA: hypothetical protein [Caudoviricetes sp.]